MGGRHILLRHKKLKNPVFFFFFFFFGSLSIVLVVMLYKSRAISSTVTNNSDRMLVLFQLGVVVHVHRVFVTIFITRVQV